MKKLLLIATLFATPAFAQQVQPSSTPEQRTIEILSNDIGNMHGQIAILVARLEAANKKIQELSAASAPPKIEDKK